MNKARIFSEARPIELSALNDAERAVLRLLAEGHTAKSVANELGTSPAAVNERLREARRKTGAGSSRELARLLKAQENRDKQFGVVPAGLSIAIVSPSAADTLRLSKGVIAMTAFFLVAAAGAAALVVKQPAVTNQVDPLVGTIPSGPDPAALHAKVRAERRDQAWAPQAEAAIRARLLQIPLIGKDGNVLRVTCATDLCEIAGTIIVVVPPTEEYDPKLPQNRAQSALQEKPLSDELAKFGLKSESGFFTGGEGKPDRMVYLLYYSRVRAK